MKKIFLLFLMLIACLCPYAQSLQGHISDSATHQTIEGASVYFPQLQLGAITDNNGNYKISHLPEGTYEVEIQLLGHASLIKQVTLKGDVTLDFASPVSRNSLKPVVIMSLGNVTNTQRSPVPVSVVTHDMILQGAYNTAIDAISTQPGVSETTEGVGTTKPQINGLGFNRVLVLTDGVPQEDFQWGDDHGILIDPYAVYDAEIIKGPGSLQYGGSAEAGVINFKTAPFVPSGTVQGSWLSEYHANNGYIGNSLHIGGNNNGFLYDLRAGGEIAHSYRNPKDGYVWGSAWNQGNARLTLGLNKSWGFSRLSFSALYRRIQVPGGNRDSATGKFIFDTPIGDKLSPTLSNFHSYNATIASDKELEEYQVWWQNSLNAGKGKIGFDIGFTSSVHHDIDTGTIGQNNMIVYNVPYSLKYQLSNAEKKFKLTTGVNGTYELMNNTAAPPDPYVPDYEIPNYTKFEIGGYAILEKDIKALTLSGGLRYDITSFVGKSMSLDSNGRIVPDATAGSIVQFTGFDNTYTGWSGSIGASYQLPQNQYVKFNISKSFRPPAINELTSNGENIGSNAYQLGNINLKPEQGYQFDLAYGYNGRDIGVELDGFYNHISNFIFADRTDSISGGLPVFTFVSSNTAVLTGLSAYLNIHPAAVKWFEMNNRFSYIYTNIPNASDSTSHLPWIPAPHLHSEFRFKLNDKHGSIMKSTYFKFGIAKYWAQNNIYSALYTELASAPYTLVNAGLGTDIANPKTERVICSFYVNCTNLTNIAYADHLNLAQYFYSQNGNLVTVTNQRQGVFNMGRDFTFKVVFPFGWQKVSDTELHGME
jgi:iron complex outermembrane receptor protein